MARFQYGFAYLSLALMIAAVITKELPSCKLNASEGNLNNGVTIVLDPSCRNGGLGCITDKCTYCRTFNTSESAHLRECDQIGWYNILTQASSSSSAETRCTASVSSSDFDVGINIIPDTNCSNGGLGCVDENCRYCKMKDTNQSAHLDPCADFGYAFEYDGDVCAASLSQGDAAAGVNIVTDPQCAFGGIGCFQETCRYCQLFDTEKSKDYVNCSRFNSSLDTFASSDQKETNCSLEFSSVTQGLYAVTDLSCQQGNASCISDQCRLCALGPNASLPNLMPCSAFRDFVFERPICEFESVYLDKEVAIIPDTNCTEESWDCFASNCRVCQFGSLAAGLSSCSDSGYAFTWFVSDSERTDYNGRGKGCLGSDTFSQCPNSL